MAWETGEVKKDLTEEGAVELTAECGEGASRAKSWEKNIPDSGNTNYKGPR